MTASFAPISFRRNHHTAILKVLRALDGPLFAKANCYFGGGTAIALSLDEYRESVDIDFLCADQQGYRTLRSLLANKPDLNSILRDGADLTTLRDVRADQYGLRTWVESDGVKIKFEIVREGRIDLTGQIDPRFGIPILDQDMMYAEKLLANSDRFQDPGVMSRDILDLSVMILRWGPIPSAAWAAAIGAYGEKVKEDFNHAIDKIRSPEWIEYCAANMAICDELVKEILTLHDGPKQRQPPPFD